MTSNVVKWKIIKIKAKINKIENRKTVDKVNGTKNWVLKR
jgi:hypothetical protein